MISLVYNEKKRHIGKILLQCVFFFSALFPVTNVFGRSVRRDSGLYTVPSLFYAYEGGVSNRLSLQDVTAYTFSNRMMLAAGIRINLNEQTGLGLFSLSAQRIPSPLRWMKFHVEVAHLEYPDFSTGENQIAALINFLPLRSLIVSAGMGYRSPDLSAHRFHSPFDWNHEMNEAYPLFNLSYAFVNTNRFRAVFFAGNYYYMNFRTLNHLLLGIDAGYHMKTNIGLMLQVQTAVKGVSGFMFSMNEVQVNAGINIDF